MLDNSKRPIYINITALAVIKIILIFVLFYFLYLVREILAILFISLILASAVDPWVDWMEKRKIPRGVGILIIYAISFSIVGSIIYLMIPPITEQINQFLDNFPKTVEKVISLFSVFRQYALEHGILENIKTSVKSLSSSLPSAGRGIFSTVSGIISGVASFFLTLVITFYMVVEENAMKKIIWSIVPAKHQVYTMHLVNRMQRKVGLWLRGQIILSLIIFTLTYIGLLILHVQYALILALIAGLTEFVPYLGPTLAAIPAMFLALTQSFMLAVFVVALYYVIQMTENHIIVPKLMQKVIGLNPIVSIAVLLIGFKIGGVIGAILAIPVATAISVFIKDLFESRYFVGENEDEKK
jgi:predicted PurR-regulated permease PerM